MTDQPPGEQPYYPESPIDFYLGDSDEKPIYTLGFFLKWGVIFFLLIISVILGMVITKAVSQLPNIKVLETYRPIQSTQLFDRSGNLIANIHGDEDRVVVPLRDISPNLQDAVMATEDNRFYEHNGVDVRGTFRAFIADMSADESVQGGSTLTQQLVKNLFLTPEKSYTRKIAEAVLALRVEKHYSKDKILEMYLNQVYFGNQSYGIEKAARRYFKESAKQLTIAQSALIAGLLKAPEGLSPYNYPEAARKRQLEVLDKMVHYGYITDKQRDHAAHEQIVLNSRIARPSKHPYFVSYVIQELEKRYGEDIVRRGGLRVYTTLDEKAQDSAEKAIYDGVTSLKPFGVKQGALVSIDVQTGNILALVGGIDFEKNQFNAATMARRAIGSTFKPFVYLTAFRLGLITTMTPISDRPVRYGNWSPHNWDGKFLGPMTVRTALMLSRNTPTVQVGMKEGIDEVIKTCRLAGLTSPITPDSSSFLGSSGVSPLELVTAYTTFARGGIYLQPTAIRRVEDSRGNIIKIDTPTPRRVFKQDYVAELLDILRDVVLKGTGRNAIIPGRQICGKTGTTDQLRDIWFMGITPDMVTGIWMGDPANKPMHGVYGSNAAAVWHQYAIQFYKDHNVPPQRFFIASDDFAATHGLIHLIDPQGVAEAKKKLGAEGKLANSDANEFTASKSDSHDQKSDKSHSHKDTEAAKSASGSSTRPETATSSHKDSNALPPNPAIIETPSQRQAKFRNWEKTLQKVQEHLNE